MDTDTVRQRQMYIHLNKNPSFDGFAKPQGEIRHKAESITLRHVREGWKGGQEGVHRPWTEPALWRHSTRGRLRCGDNMA